MKGGMFRGECGADGISEYLRHVASSLGLPYLRHQLQRRREKSALSMASVICAGCALQDLVDKVEAELVTMLSKLFGILGSICAGSKITCWQVHARKSLLDRRTFQDTSTYKLNDSV